MDKSLIDKVAIVTGAGQGLGRGIVIELAAQGAAIAVVDWNKETAADAAAELVGTGAKAIAIHCDVGNRAHVEAAIAATVQAFGGLTTVVNNAQSLRAEVKLEDHTDADFDLALRTGLWGAFYFMRGAFAHLKARGGSVINITSAVGTHGVPGFAGYAAAKEGMRGLTKVAAGEWGQYGIRVNALCPTVETPARQAWAREHPELEAAALAKIPLRRRGDPRADIGSIVAFLASDAGSYLTGQTIMATGGWAMNA
jgi:NAD(P)-dependent dehydrogenase (short-subunit alcohol dehydrogenase family)